MAGAYVLHPDKNQKSERLGNVKLVYFGSPRMLFFLELHFDQILCDIFKKSREVGDLKFRNKLALYPSGVQELPA
jgi:hypothetical protein